LASVAVQRPALWEQAAIYTLQAGDQINGVAYLQNAHTADALSGAGYMTLGDLLLEQGNPDTALAAWENALAQGAPPLAVHRRTLAVHRAAHNFPAAIADLRAILALSPADAQAQYQLGLLLTTREPEAALASLIQAANLDASLADAVRLLERTFRPSEETDDPAYTLVNVGRALASLGEWELAREAFSQAVAANPDYAEAWAFLGEAKGQLGEDGLLELDTALTLNPASLTANLLYALYHKRQGNLELALVYLHAADNVEPGNPSIQVEIGSTLNEMGNFNRALTYFQKAVLLAPHEATYLYLLAQFCYQNNTFVEEIGLVAMRQALVLDAQDPVALDLMGFGYYLLNDMPLAQRFLLRALELTPEAPRPWFHLGLVSLAVGDTQQAYDQLTRAIALDPASATAEQAQRVLMQYFP
jgi:tetratricopeptide (TPR) repeat protein